MSPAMLRSKALICLVALVLDCSSIKLSLRTGVGSNASSGGSPSTFMLTAGITSSEEMCLVGNAGVVYLDTCTGAMAAGDGRELWSLQTGGQLTHVVSKLCAGASQPVVGESVALVACSGAGIWKLLPNGQAQIGEHCLSQVGVVAGLGNVAAHASAQASSSAHPASHGAAAAMDFDEGSFWASRPDEASPVEFTVDLGERRSVNLLKITWEYPPQAFSVSSSADGEHWEQAFTTDVNMESVTRIPLRQTLASKIKVVMRQPHALFGKMSGHSYYAIKSISVLAPRLRAALDDCAAAARSKDARDKYFPSYVSNFDPSSASVLQAELPQLLAAKASLSSALSRIAAVQAKVSECGSTRILRADVHDAGVLQGDTLLASLSRSASPVSGLEELADIEQGIDLVGIEAFLALAKATIVDMRASLM